jgi:hypothetical protein
VRWANRINALCARRNEHLYHLDYRDWPDEELARFTTEAIEVWHDYEQQAAKLRPPPSYRYRARMLAGSDAAFRDGLLEIRKQARVGRDRAVDYAIATLQETASANYAVLAYVGVPQCAGFEPYRPLD